MLSPRHFGGSLCCIHEPKSTTYHVSGNFGYHFNGRAQVVLSGSLNHIGAPEVHSGADFAARAR
jgi:hypothetical protein